MTETELNGNQGFVCEGVITVLLLKKRDPATWKAIIEAFSPRLQTDVEKSLRKGLRRHQIELTKEQERAAIDDIMQNTWKTAYEIISEFNYEGIEKARNFLRMISLNHVRRLVKKCSKDRARHLSIDFLDEALESSGGSSDNILYRNGQGVFGESPEKVVLDRAFVREVVKIMDRLKLNQRHCEIFFRHYLNGESIDELSEAYGVEKGSIHKTLLRVCQSLRPFYDEEGW